MLYIIVTNNKCVYEKFKNKFEMVYNKKFTYMDVLEKARDKIHAGYELLTHPLSGSIKPNETPYKSILLSEKGDDLDIRGLNIIEESIETSRKFLKDRNTPQWINAVLEDFRAIDLSLIENVVKKLY